ncbi:uncharacterized protein LOC121920369 [Sceloporus undulatus]|uniref:uncharacterized protein LOC121920369 n=1 Tax=Sceloporus undulatus TaxID=8520 RepID=UPI001C4B0431|nr:uncharacterized protein LOC121920369 [Sceloporus undulatus]
MLITTHQQCPVKRTVYQHTTGRGKTGQNNLLLHAVTNVTHNVVQKLEKPESSYGNEYYVKYVLKVGTMQYSVLSTSTMLHCLLLRWTILVAFSGFLATGAESLVQGKVGQDVTLPCYYSVAKHGTTTMCWGQGSCPSSWCSDPIVWIDTYWNINRQSSNYHLTGHIQNGDVSLTILNVTEEDAGLYCCRVEIPGWFNDQKISVRVVIKEGKSGPDSSVVTALIDPTTIDFTESHFALDPRWMSSTEPSRDNISLYFFTPMKEQRKKESSLTGLYVGIGVCSVLLATVTLLLLKWYLLKKQKMTNSVSVTKKKQHRHGAETDSMELSICTAPRTLVAKQHQGVIKMAKIMNRMNTQVGTLSQNVVRGVVGQAITLPCTYNVRQLSDLTDMCWGQGSCPNSKCSNEILRTNGMRVTSKKSQRYQLKGQVTRGDVSLTIANLNERDKGLYCCRVEIKGWFNDIKKTLNLQIERAITTTTTTTTTMTTMSQRTTTTLTTTSLKTISTVPLTFPLTTKSAFPTTPNTTSGLMLPTSSLSPITTAPSFLLKTKSASSITPTATDHLTPSTSSMPTAIIVTTTIPPFLLTTKPTSIKTPSVTDDLTLLTSMSKVTAFLATDTPLENIKSLPTNFQYVSIKNDVVTTETDPLTTGTGQTILDFSKKYYPVLIPCSLVFCIFPLTLGLWQIKCKKMKKYDLNKMESLDIQEEPEQTPVGMEGEDGLFPL